MPLAMRMHLKNRNILTFHFKFCAISNMSLYQNWQNSVVMVKTTGYNRLKLAWDKLVASKK